MARKRRKKLPTELQLAVIEKLNHEGRGIATINGKVTFIRNALAGETLEFRYTNKRSNFDEGEAVNIIEPAANRIAAKCEVYGICGGCSFQHLSSSDQILHKQQILQELLAQQNVSPENWLQPLTSKEFQYRRKARIGVRNVPKKGDVLVGFREINGRFLTNMQRCEVLHPLVGERIIELRKLLSSLEIKDKIPQLEVAVDDHKAAIIIRHLVELSETDIALIKEFANQHDLHIYLQPKGLDSIKLLTPTTIQLSYTLPNQDITINFNPEDFTQVNYEINQQMIDLVIKLLEPKTTDKVLDLFCGLGNFSLAVAKKVDKVVGIEGDLNMTKRAAENAKLNNLENTGFFAADLFNPTTGCEWLTEDYSKLILDPPRAGAKEIIDAVANKRFEKIIYISCNPTTLARDAGKLVNEQKYKLVNAGVMDMFPQTTHVESIAYFTR